MKAAALAVCIVTAAAAAGEMAGAVSEISDSGYRLSESFEENDVLRNALGIGVNELVAAVTDNSETAVFDKRVIDDLDLEYYAEDLATGKVITNTGDKEKKNYISGTVPGMYVTVEKKDSELSVDGNKYVTNSLSGYSGLIYEYNPYADEYESADVEYADGYAPDREERKPLDDYVVYLKVNDDRAEEMLILWQRAQAAVDGALRALPVYAVIFILALVYLSFAAGRRAEDDEIHLLAVDRIFLDISVLIAVAAGICMVFGVAACAYTSPDDDIYRMYSMLAAGAGSAVIVTCWLSIVKHLKNGTLINSSVVCRTVRWVWRLFTRIVKWIFVSLPKRIKEVYASLKILAAKNAGYVMFIAASAVFMGMTVLLSWLTGALLYEGDAVSLLMILICIALIGVPVALIYKTLKGYDLIREGLEKIRGGETLYKIPINGSFITNSVAEDINAIGEGLSKAVDESVRSERMKAELITNVSHDLKTPLTSIINYTDLLMQQKLTPEEANDYVKIIDKKSKKLKQLTSDLFTVSKARSGNEELELESIDHKLLITQAEAELDNEIKKAGLEFILDLPEQEIRVTADGKKLSRVYENLISNAVKYSMKGTRVYIVMTVADGVCRTEIKNIAGYKMDFDDEEITERFVRGDASRTGEGSGLGLAIARSYVELMGGRFYIKTDGDLFKAVTEFKTE